MVNVPGASFDQFSLGACLPNFDARQSIARQYPHHSLNLPSTLLLLCIARLSCTSAELSSLACLELDRIKP